MSRDEENPSQNGVPGDAVYGDTGTEPADLDSPPTQTPPSESADQTQNNGHTDSPQNTESSKKSDLNSVGLPDVDGFTWTDKGRTTAKNAPSGDYSPPGGTDSNRYLKRRQPPLTDGLPAVTTHIRPELNQALSLAQMDADRFFMKQGSSQEIKTMDFYEAALTVALFHQKEVFALLAEFGYGSD